MSVASLFGGLALANAKLGAVHGFAGVLGGMFPAPHGAVCARLLPLVLEQNVISLRQREPGNPALERYREVARLLTGRPDAEIEDGVDWLRVLVQELAIPPLSDYGLEEKAFADVIAKSARASSMQGNPIMLTEEEMGAILEKAY
jgi:alcohol dehydrogenase class IV